MLDVDGKLQWETPVVINRNLVARYSRRYFDKAPQVASNKRVERQARVGCESSDYICESLVQICISFLTQVDVEFRDMTIFGANSGIVLLEARSCLCSMLIDPFFHPHINVTAVRRTRVKAWSI